MQQPTSQAEFAVLIWNTVDTSAKGFHSGSSGTLTSRTCGMRVLLPLFRGAFDLAVSNFTHAFASPYFFQSERPHLPEIQATHMDRILPAGAN